MFWCCLYIFFILCRCSCVIQYTGDEGNIKFKLDIVQCNLELVLCSIYFQISIGQGSILSKAGIHETFVKCHGCSIREPVCFLRVYHFSKAKCTSKFYSTGIQL